MQIKRQFLFSGISNKSQYFRQMNETKALRRRNINNLKQFAPKIQTEARKYFDFNKCFFTNAKALECSKMSLRFGAGLNPGVRTC